MTKTQAISLQILALVAEGMTAVEAAKAVLGAERVEQMIGEVYAALRERAA